MRIPVLAIIIPCRDEEESIEHTLKRLLEVFYELKNNNKISDKSFIFCIDDGSNDNTWDLIKKCNKEFQGSVKGIKFSRNFGNQRAILAGLFESSKYNPDCYISLDADLQQDENKIAEFLEKYENGAKIVFGIRNDRKTDGFFKKNSALAFYKLMNILGVNLKKNHSDYRLVSSEVVDTLRNFPETNMFLRGIFNELGFKKDYVYFDVKERYAGKTKYNFFSLFSLAINGITSFSIVPLRFVTILGFIMSIASFAVGVSAVIDKLWGNSIVPGWTTIVVALGFIGGIQILCVGIIGEYLGQLFQEVKSRPRYIIEETAN
ncbi:MAG: glycosyltransferase family 2 protein [Candidatus Gastranaerophilales bacterium]|nr:glycosyltransferase family 2 protein [Candidatus Gastranaerophilales bacterium]